jgi:vacuolar protein sorting-associated protein IST1
LQEKKLALAKKSRRDIADLLLKNRVETARLRVEGLIQDDIYVELLELLEVGPSTRDDRVVLVGAFTTYVRMTWPI